MHKMNSKDVHTLTHWIFGFQMSQAIFVAAKLGIADLLDEGPLSCQTIAKITETDVSALYRLLRALACQGIFSETDDTIFVNTELSGLLSIRHESSMKSMALMYGEEQYRAWGDLYSSIKSGKESFTAIYKEDFYTYLNNNPPAQTILNQYLDQNALQRIKAIIEAYDFSNTKRLVDVGGGDGGLLFELLHQYPHIQGTLQDSQEVIDSVVNRVQKKDFSERIAFKAGNFLEEVPSGADTYFLSNIIHGWDDDDAIKILKNCYNSMTKPGKLILVEHMIKTKNSFDPAKWMDLNMLVTLNGKERTEEEYAQLLEAAHFKLARCIPTSVGSFVIEADTCVW